MAQWKLFYDGGCNLCEATQSRFARWAQRAGYPLQTQFLQSDEALEKGYVGDQIVLEADGEVLYGPDAALRLLRYAPFPLRWFAWMGRFAFTRWMTRMGYRLVARYRYAVFGRKTCALPKR